MTATYFKIKSLSLLASKRKIFFIDKEKALGIRELGTHPYNLVLYKERDNGVRYLLVGFIISGVFPFV
jgi:hypothetical protein